jgi:hypothetical protein
VAVMNVAASTASIAWSSSSSIGVIVHDRAWWKIEARRLGSDWRGIAETAWLDPQWRFAARDYRGNK